MDKFVFYSKSADAKPGYGINEQLESGNEYNLPPNWRKTLSNFHEAEFDYPLPSLKSNHTFTYKTIEHAFQGMKISIANAPLGFSFSLNSDSELSKSSGIIARKARKLVILSEAELMEWDEIKSKVLESIIYAKSMQVDEYRNILLATDTAELWHAGPRIKPVRMVEMESVRAKLMA